LPANSIGAERERALISAIYVRRGKAVKTKRATAFKAQGPGWQSRMQDTLKRAASRLKKTPAARTRG
jgi:uncharacterized protein (DUF4415 family)